LFYHKFEKIHKLNGSEVFLESGASQKSDWLFGISIEDLALFVDEIERDDVQVALFETGPIPNSQ
jgi:hypothetical protein